MRPLLLALVALVGWPVVARAETWRWPVRGPVIARFRYDETRPFGAGQRRGIDIAAPSGTPVRSACRGRVTFAGAVGRSGRTVAVACGALGASYLHLGAVSVRRGAELLAGEELGTVGSSGRPREPTPHVSFGVRVLRWRWRYLDPLGLLGEPRAASPPVGLLPTTRRLPPLGPAPRAAPVVAPRPLVVPAARAARLRAPGRSSAPLGAWWLPLGLALLATAGGAAVLGAVAGRRGGARGRRAATIARSRAEV